MQDSPRFGQLVKALREHRGLSLRKLAALTGISNGYLSQIEGCKVGPPSSKVVAKLSSALNHSYFEMMIAAGYFHADKGSQGEFLKIKNVFMALDDLSEDAQDRLLHFVLNLKSGSNG